MIPAPQYPDAAMLTRLRNAPDRAKADLKKQLQLRNIRKSIANSILAQLDLSNPAEPDFRSSHPKPHMPQQDSAISMTFDESQRPASVASLRSSTRPDSALTSSTVSHARADSANTHSYSKSDTAREKIQSSFSQSKGDPPRREALLSAGIHEDALVQAQAPLLDEEGQKIDPIYVNTAKEFDEIVRDMQPHFEGRESEQNWSAREKSILKLRKLTRGNAPQDFNAHYIAGIKTLLDGILKTVNSLRTTLSTNGCSLVQDVARTTGPGLDSMVEILLQSLIKLCGGTKKISAQNGNLTVDAIVGNVSYNVRLLHHLWNACQDKNMQPRSFATGWLKTLIIKHGRHKSSIEHSGGLELIEKCIKKGLTDANPGVREGMRGTYWTFAKIWPEKAEL
jgi:CLIP-associating protein 1/2